MFRLKSSLVNQHDSVFPQPSHTVPDISVIFATYYMLMTERNTLRDIICKNEELRKIFSWQCCLTKRK